jgi:hypothetical protein
MRTFITAVMLLMLFSVGRAQEPLPVPVEPREGAMAISQVQKLAPPDAGRFGYSMDANGNSEGSILVVGAPTTTVDSIARAGAVFVYRMGTDGLWQFWQRMTLPVPTLASFGYSVSVTGPGADTRIAIGAPLEKINRDNTGRVYIYRIEGDTWINEVVLESPAPPVWTTGMFGQAVALTGSGDDTILAIGEPDTKIYPSETITGRVHIYGRSGSLWNHETMLYPPDNATSLGGRIELIGTGNDTLMAVASNSSGLYLFSRPYGVWQPEQRLGFGTQTGHEFAISGAPGQRIIVIGDQNSWQGSLYVYRHDGTEWILSDVISAMAPPISISYYSAFGGQVAVSGDANDAVIYASISSTSYPHQNRLLRIRLAAGEITLLDEIHSPEASSVGFGIRLFVPPSSTDDGIISGSPYMDTGIVHVFGNEPGVNVFPEAFTIVEGSAGNAYRISLSALPMADVVITADPAEGCDLGAGDGQPITRIFTPADWRISHSVTVTSEADDTAEGTVSCAVAHRAASDDESYDGIAVATVNVTVNDPPSVPTDIILTGHQSLAVTEGGSVDSYSYALTAQPTATVTLHVTPDFQCDVGGGFGRTRILHLGTETWQTPEGVRVEAADDALNEGTHQCIITHTVTGATEYAGKFVSNITVTITDNDAANLIANGDFESGIAPWTIKNKTGDKVLCDTAERRAAFAGSCAFQFKGGAVENASLTQNVDLSGAVFGPSDAIRLQVMIDGGAAAKGKLKLRVLYAGGEDTVVKLALPTAGAYALTESAWLLLESPEVQAITVTIQHKSAKGKVWVDNVALWHRPLIVLRESALDTFRAP